MSLEPAKDVGAEQHGVVTGEPVGAVVRVGVHPSRFVGVTCLMMGVQLLLCVLSVRTTG